MKEDLETMSELVDLLNEFAINHPENPIITSQDWPFTFTTDMQRIGIISLHENTLIQTNLPGPNTIAHNFDPPMRKMEMLKEMKNSLESWLLALRSDLWAVERVIERLED